MSDYTPSMGAVKVAYKNRRPGLAYVIGVQNPDPEGEFDRFIAKVKADALREAAEDMDNTDDPDAIHIANGDADLWLKACADRIEGQ